MNNLLRLKGLNKSYKSGGEPLPILQDFELEVQKGECLAVVGPSGSGKTTLLNIIAGLDQPDSGEIHFGNQHISGQSEKDWAKLRAAHLGFIFQFHQLLPEFSALENIMIPALILRRPMNQARSEAYSLLDKVGLKARSDHRPAQLSGGEQQRVAVARALMNKPSLVLADEPTGNLDGPTGNQLFELLMNLNREYKMAFIMVTHNQELAARCDRMVALSGDLGPISKPDGA